MLTSYLKSAGEKGDNNMEQTKAFFSALEQWKDDAKPEVNDYDTLLFMIAYTLGGDNFRTLALEDTIRPGVIQQRVEDLVSKQRMQEDFLVTSLVQMVDETLEHKISGLGDSITFHLQAKESGKIKDKAEEMLNKLTHPGYIYKAQRELEAWRVIAIQKLGNSNRQRWQTARILSSNK